jgi:ribosomal protein L37E
VDVSSTAAMVAANIDIFAMMYEESMAYLKRLENLEKIRRTNSPSPTLHVDNKKFGTSSIGVGKSNKSSKQWCHFCGKNSHNTADCRAIAKAKQQKRLLMKPKLFPERSLWLFFSKKLMQSKGN